MNASQTIFQIQIPACTDSAELSGFLSDQEFLGLWEEAGTFTIYWQGHPDYFLQQLQDALALCGVTLTDSLLSPEPMKLEDWNAQWAASVKPVRIGRRIGIRPSWETLELPEDGIELVIDPKQAFGTGHHTTTQLLVAWLEDWTWAPHSRVLDVGTGSGILSMIALRLGAEFALGIDYDAVAIDYAREYAALNGFAQEELELQCNVLQDLKPQGFDIIMANIDRQTILDLSTELTRFRSPTTQLVLSGLLEEDESDIREMLKQCSWKWQATRRCTEWIAIQFSA